MPELPGKDAKSDFYFIDRAEPEQISETLVEMVKARIPVKFKFDAIRDVQVLCSMNRGSLGIRERRHLMIQCPGSRPVENTLRVHIFGDTGST